MGLGIKALLLGGCRAIPDQPCPRNIAALAIAPDQVGIEGEQFSGTDHTRPTFLKPRVRARARAQNAGFNPLAPTLDIFCMKNGPDIILGHAGFNRSLHRRHRSFAGIHGAAHGVDLVRAFEGAGFLGAFLAIHDLHAETAQGIGPVQHDLVDPAFHVPAAMGVQQINNLSGELMGYFLAEISGREVKHARPAARFAHQRIVIGEIRDAFVLPHQHIAVRADERRAERIMGIPKLHMCGVGGIADVERIKQQEPIPAPRIDRRR